MKRYLSILLAFLLMLTGCKSKVPDLRTNSTVSTLKLKKQEVEMLEFLFDDFFAFDIKIDKKCKGIEISCDEYSFESDEFISNNKYKTDIILANDKITNGEIIFSLNRLSNDNSISLSYALKLDKSITKTDQLCSIGQIPSIAFESYKAKNIASPLRQSRNGEFIFFAVVLDEDNNVIIEYNIKDPDKIPENLDKSSKTFIVKARLF